MIAVISEVWPRADRRQDYFRLSEELRPLLQQMDGFVSVERFESSARLRVAACENVTAKCYDGDISRKRKLLDRHRGQGEEAAV